MQVIATRDMPYDDEYITPLNVFLYTQKINNPKTNAIPSAANISGIDNAAALFKKLKFKISLKSIVNTPFFLYIQFLLLN
jgi:hypothetical protein